MNICHVTSGHLRNDVRVYLKEVSSLRNNGFNTLFIVADGLGNDPENFIYDVGKPKGRLYRFTTTTKKILKLAKTLRDVEVFHFHDPELIPVALKLKRKGKKIIFDFHEDVPKQLLTKPYLNPFLLKILSRAFAAYERNAAKKFDYIISTTIPSKNKFLAVNNNSEVINNYPLPTEFIKAEQIKRSNNKTICYVGGISRERGILELINALELLDDIKLKLAGNFKTAEVEEEAKELKAWNKVEFYGYVSRGNSKDLSRFYCRNRYLSAHTSSFRSSIE